MPQSDLHHRERRDSSQATCKRMAQRVRRATDVEVSALAVALEDVAQGAGGQATVATGDQQRRVWCHGKAAHTIEGHQVEDGLAGNRVERHLAMVTTFADHFEPLARGASVSHNVADVEGHQLARAQAGVQIEDNESSVTSPEGRALGYSGQKLVNRGWSENAHKNRPPFKVFA